jgi:hypothetical protein
MPVLRFPRALGVFALSVTATASFLPLPSSVRRTAHALRRPPAAAPLDTAIARMGGEDALRKIERVRFEMMTLWQRMAFETRQSDLIGTYELHSDLRNYTLGAWRNTRRFVSGPALREMTDVVQKDAAIRRFPPGPDGTLPPFAPLNTAYVDERKEVFAFAPERLLLAARAASDLRVLADTTMLGLPHARVSATVDGFPTTIFVRRNDGFLAMARYRAAQPNDFGLAPWGEMEVEMWYSRWAKFPVPGTQGIGYPTEWDVRRVGRMYKRLTVLSANFDAAAPADSFAISDSLRAAFASGIASRPMWDVPMDSAKLLEPRLARLGNLGQAQAAVKLGNAWLMLEGTGMPQRNETDVQWLKAADAGATVAGLLITMPNSGRGGAVWFAEKKLPVYVAPGAAAAMSATLANWKQPKSAATVVSRPQWLRVGGDSLWVEAMDFPDFPGAVIAYVPSMRWAYSGIAASPLVFDMVVARIRERGWTVDRIGSLRTLTQPIPARTASR